MFRRNRIRHGGNSPKLMVVYYVWKRRCTRKRFYRRLLFLLHSFSVSKRLPLVCCSLIYLVAFPSFLLPCATLYRFFLLPFFHLFCVCLNLSPQNSQNGCFLGHSRAFISFFLLLPLLLISLPLSSVVICRVLGFKWSQTFHFHALQKLHVLQHKEHMGTTRYSRDMPKVCSNVLSLSLNTGLKC
jgi:hypothetical protein